MTPRKQSPIKALQIAFDSGDNVTAFGGIALVERLARRLGLWEELEASLDRRRGHYSWLEILKTATVGLLTGAQGTYATQELRQERALLEVLGVAGAPEEVTLWRCLEALGRPEALKALAGVQRWWARKVLSRAVRKELLYEGFVPVFGDGELSEGSPRREATTVIRNKGKGLLWTALFVGSVGVAQHLCGEGEGEQSALRAMLPVAVHEVLKPLRLWSNALLLVDSLHGDGPTLDLVESLRLHYVAGANKLTETNHVLSEQPETQWEDTGANPQRGWEESAVCVCSIQCGTWKHKRTLVGIRWREPGKLFYEYRGVLTDLRPRHVKGIMARGLSYARAIWHLYRFKAGLEDLFKDLLSDLDLHHPPCQQYERNAAFYGIGMLAHTLARGVDLLGGREEDRGQELRRDGKPRKRPTPRRWRIATLRRRLLTIPARITRHARTLTATFLGVSDVTRALIERFWSCLCRC